jgi:hypothetical protein
MLDGLVNVVMRLAEMLILYVPEFDIVKEAGVVDPSPIVTVVALDSPATPVFHTQLDPLKMDSEKEPVVPLEYNSPKSPPRNGPVAPVAPDGPVAPDTDPSSVIFHELSIKS